MQKTLFNFLLFQAAWFSTIIAAVAGYPYLGIILTIGWMVLHLNVFSENKLAELNLLLFAGLLGYTVDSVQVYLGVFAFPPEVVFGSPSTLWMVALWVNLAATLNFSLSWLQDKYFLAAVLGAISGPAAYYAGSQLGAMSILTSWSLYAISLQWFICMPLLFWFAQWQPVLEPEELIKEINGE